MDKPYRCVHFFGKPDLVHPASQRHGIALAEASDAHAATLQRRPEARPPPSSFTQAKVNCCQWPAGVAVSGAQDGGSHDWIARPLRRQASSRGWARRDSNPDRGISKSYNLESPVHALLPLEEASANQLATQRCRVWMVLQQHLIHLSFCVPLSRLELRRQLAKDDLSLFATGGNFLEPLTVEEVAQDFLFPCFCLNVIREGGNALHTEHIAAQRAQHGFIESIRADGAR